MNVWVYGQSRATPVLERILALHHEVVAATLAATMDKFSARYDDLPAVLAENFASVAHRVGASSDLPEATRLLVGAYFTHEFSIEAAAIFNPSIVLHPDQCGLMPGEARVVLSLRAVREGHLSSIEFRTGVADPDGQVRIDASANHLVVGRPYEATFDRRLFQRALSELGDAGEDAAYVLETLPDHSPLENWTTPWARSTISCSPDARLTEPSSIYDGWLAATTRCAFAKTHN